MGPDEAFDMTALRPSASRHSAYRSRGRRGATALDQKRIDVRDHARLVVLSTGVFRNGSSTIPLHANPAAFSSEINVGSEV